MLTELTRSFNPFYFQYFNLYFFVVVQDLSTRNSGIKRRVYNRFNDEVKIVILFGLAKGFSQFPFQLLP